VNSSAGGIGASTLPEFNISGDGEHQGYETWIAQANATPPALSAYTHQIQFEKNSGLRLKEDMLQSVTGEFSVEYHLRATQFEDVITGSPTDTDRYGSIMLAAGSIVCVAVAGVVVVVARKRV
jgi:hypothetical protein